MNVKTILLVSAAAIGSGIVFGKNKVNRYKEVLEKMEVNPKGVRNFKLQGSSLAFDIDVELVNPTGIPVDIPGNLITVKNLHFFTATGKKLGTATPNVAQISLPANGSRLITNIPAVFDLRAIGASFTEAVQIALNPDAMLVATDIQAFGTSFTVNP